MVPRKEIIPMTPLTLPAPACSLDCLQHLFLMHILPRVEAHGRIYFRHIKCPHRKEDAIQEMVGLAWKWHIRLAEKGKDATCFPTALATFAARAVRSGRRLCGQERPKDVLSPTAQQRRGFAVEKLPDISTLESNPLTDALIDNMQTPVPEQVCFRCDLPAWLDTLSERDQSITQDLMIGERTMDVAGKYRLTPGRISQLRRELFLDWQAFCNELPDMDRPSPGKAV
jgi:hypothetical protein